MDDKREWTDVAVIVGAIYTRFKDGRRVPVLPIVEATFPPGGDVPVPERLEVSWREKEKDPAPGDRTRIWISAPDAPEPEKHPYLTIKVQPEHRDIFERLRGLWGYWFLRVNLEGRTQEVQIASGSGIVRPLQTSVDNFISNLDGMTRESFLRKSAKDTTLREEWDQGESRDLYPTKRLFLAHIRAETRRIVKTIEEIGGPMPWRIDWEALEGDRRRKVHELIVHNYVLCMEDVRWLANAVKDKGGELADDASWLASAIWAMLRQARIFELTPEAYGALHHVADVYTTEKIAYQEWMHPDSGKYPTEEQQEAHLRLISEAGERVPFPEQMPFEVCYFAWGQGVPFTTEQLLGQGFTQERLANCTRGTLVSTLVCARGVVVSFYTMDDEEGKPKIISHAIHRWSEATLWRHPYSLTPWIVTAVVAAVNEHQTLVVEGKRSWDDRKLFKKAARRIGVKHPIPPSYYTVYMRDKQIEASARREFRRQLDVEWSHRWDVRGCEVVRIRRGTMPIDPKLLRRLERRGYKVFTMDRPDADSYRALMARDVSPPKSDEWIAVLISWRKPHVKGPEGKPYIPSVHKPTKGMIAR